MNLNNNTKYTLIQDIHRDITIIKANSSILNTPLPKKNAMNTRTWTQVASSPAAPPSLQRTMSGISSTAASIESPKHKEIVIRYKGNKAVLYAQRKLRPSELVKKLNVALTSTEDTLIMAAKFKAARINGRGSIVAHTETVAQAETLRRHKEERKGFVAIEAEIMLPVNPVIVHGTPIQSIDPGNKVAFIEQLRIENRQVIA
ncbi:uncharacterized protein PV09_09640 [Verruconis gallopava]|uniref:Uncharacterized protein n=1 Tax=Verruconis gallopava TaxID=253628 RepID=A0A0D1ZX18_9PEZI|nr:uncharacterized protein PV09_09640 [Verruconis gallopava]KIV98559.1 hypothetical protein PV09_09640 [Verruconis gallopava]